MKYDDALILAKELVEALSPACRRIEIAGSVRRQKPECHDLEIVAIPSWEVQQRLNLFGEVGEIIQVNRLDQRLAELFDAGEWVLDEKLPRNGPKYKRLAHLATGLCCDLFLITRQGWGGAMVIRTGPADFSRAVVTVALRQGKHVADGYLLHGHPKETGCPYGEKCPRIVPTFEEEEFLTALGLRWVDPPKRTSGDTEHAMRMSMS